MKPYVHAIVMLAGLFLVWTAPASACGHHAAASAAVPQTHAQAAVFASRSSLQLPPNSCPRGCIGGCCCPGLSSCGQMHAPGEAPSGFALHADTGNTWLRAGLHDDLKHTAPLYGLERPPKA